MSEIEEKTTPKRLKESEWIVAVTLWERGEVTLKELSEKFGVSEAAISQGLKRRNAKRGSKAHTVGKAISDKVADEKEKLVEEIFEFKKRFIKYGNLLAQLTIAEITEAKSKAEPLVARKGNLEVINIATKNLKNIRSDLYHLYDLNDPDNKPDEIMDFNIGVYTQEDLENIHEANQILGAGNSNLPDDDEEDEDDRVYEGEDD